MRASGEVAGFIPESGNFGISYVRNKWDIRVQFNHVGRYLQTFNANQALLLYKTARSVVDIKTSYALNKKLGIYLNVDNVFNEAGWARMYINERPQQIQKLTPSFSFGVNAGY